MYKEKEEQNIPIPITGAKKEKEPVTPPATDAKKELQRIDDPAARDNKTVQNLDVQPGPDKTATDIATPAEHTVKEGSKLDLPLTEPGKTATDIAPTLTQTAKVEKQTHIPSEYLWKQLKEVSFAQRISTKDLRELRTYEHEGKVENVIGEPTDKALKSETPLEVESAMAKQSVTIAPGDGLNKSAINIEEASSGEQKTAEAIDIEPSTAQKEIQDIAEAPEGGQKSLQALEDVQVSGQKQHVDIADSVHEYKSQQDIVVYNWQTKDMLDIYMPGHDEKTTIFIPEVGHISKQLEEIIPPERQTDKDGVPIDWESIVRNITEVIHSNLYTGGLKETVGMEKTIVPVSSGINKEENVIDPDGERGLKENGAQVIDLHQITQDKMEELYGETAASMDYSKNSKYNPETITISTHQTNGAPGPTKSDVSFSNTPKTIDEVVISIASLLANRLSETSPEQSDTLGNSGESKTENDIDINARPTLSSNITPGANLSQLESTMSGEAFNVKNTGGEPRISVTPSGISSQQSAGILSKEIVDSINSAAPNEPPIEQTRQIFNATAAAYAKPVTGILSSSDSTYAEHARYGDEINGVTNNNVPFPTTTTERDADGLAPDRFGTRSFIAKTHAIEFPFTVGTVDISQARPGEHYSGLTSESNLYAGSLYVKPTAAATTDEDGNEIPPVNAIDYSIISAAIIKAEQDLNSSTTDEQVYSIDRTKAADGTTLDSGFRNYAANTNALSSIESDLATFKGIGSVGVEITRPTVDGQLRNYTANTAAVGADMSVDSATLKDDVIINPLLNRTAVNSEGITTIRGVESLVSLTEISGMESDAQYAKPESLIPTYGGITTMDTRVPTQNIRPGFNDGDTSVESTMAGRSATAKQSFTIDGINRDKGIRIDSITQVDTGWEIPRGLGMRSADPGFEKQLPLPLKLGIGGLTGAQATTSMPSSILGQALPYYDLFFSVNRNTRPVSPLKLFGSAISTAISTVSGQKTGPTPGKIPKTTELDIVKPIVVTAPGQRQLRGYGWLSIHRKGSDTQDISGTPMNTAVGGGGNRGLYTLKTTEEKTAFSAAGALGQGALSTTTEVEAMDQYIPARIPFQFTPEITGDSKSATWSALSVLGRSSALYTYAGSQNRQLGLNLTYAVLQPEPEGTDKSLSMANTVSDLVKSGIQGNILSTATAKLLGSIDNQGMEDLEGWDESIVYWIVNTLRGLVVPQYADETKTPPVIRLHYGEYFKKRVSRKTANNVVQEKNVRPLFIVLSAGITFEGQINQETKRYQIAKIALSLIEVDENIFTYEGFSDLAGYLPSADPETKSFNASRALAATARNIIF